MDDLRRIAHRAMLEHGLQPDFPPPALAQLAAIQRPADAGAPVLRDLRDLLWASIDNDDSLDLDQLSVAEPLAHGSSGVAGDAVKILVAIADVDALVPSGSPIDDHARINTTSVYTAAQIFQIGRAHV